MYWTWSKTLLLLQFCGYMKMQDIEELLQQLNFGILDVIKPL